MVTLFTHNVSQATMLEGIFFNEICSSTTLSILLSHCVSVYFFFEDLLISFFLRQFNLPTRLLYFLSTFHFVSEFLALSCAFSNAVNTGYCKIS